MKSLTLFLLWATAAAQSFFVSVRKAHPLPHEYLNRDLEKYYYYRFEQGKWVLRKYYAVTARDTAQRIISTLTAEHFHPIQKRFWEYDDSGRVVKYTLMKKDTKTDQWCGKRWLISYTREGRLLQRRQEQMDSAGNWREYHTYSYFYTPDGRISERLRTIAGKNLGKAVCKYNANDKIQTIEYSYWNDSAQVWVLHSRNVFKYQADGSYSRFNSEFFDGTTGTWHTDNIYCPYYSYSFDAQNRMLSYEMLSYVELSYMEGAYYLAPMVGISWEQDSTGRVIKTFEWGEWNYPYLIHTDFYFDNRGRLVSKIQQKELIQNFSKTLSSKSEYYYNALDSLKRVITYYWDGKDSVWVPAYKYEYVYKNGDPRIYLYPNPSKTRIFIAGLKPSQTFNAEIYSAEGKLIQEILFRPEMGIPVEDLPKGIYFVRIFSGNLFLTAEKFIKSE